MFCIIHIGIQFICTRNDCEFFIKNCIPLRIKILDSIENLLLCLRKSFKKNSWNSLKTGRKYKTRSIIKKNTEWYIDSVSIDVRNCARFSNVQIGIANIETSTKKRKHEQVRMTHHRPPSWKHVRAKSNNQNETTEKNQSNPIVKADFGIREESKQTPRLANPTDWNGLTNSNCTRGMTPVHHHRVHIFNNNNGLQDNYKLRVMRCYNRRDGTATCTWYCNITFIPALELVPIWEYKFRVGNC